MQQAMPPKLHPSTSPFLRLELNHNHSCLLINPNAIASNHLPQLVFLGELPAQSLEVADEGFAAIDQRIFR